ncbi:hypothetical protein Skr01_06680 [Sphaerisporangium krabiense]|uniref:Peptidase S1 domain-containing protein n=1 Tax=Sphaerisporangium krabiense TaxID=763782 RepID=A0A7W9DRI4_9ACTN|nr:hypothetical protein [Sphaerisporangium krabiense]MBB5628581.1 hypothetical protein [Sphaerisporangium krabiense]GII60583.1 hypothetical protein Skr01_06680 [Sphaerisporangium krabiense]
MTPILPLVAALSLLAGLLGAPSRGPARPLPASAPVTRPGPAGVIAHAAARTRSERRRVLGYWTHRRMARALPADLLGQMSALGALASGAVPPPASATPVRLPVPPWPGAAGPPARRRASGARVGTTGARWAAGGAVTRTVGRVFLTMRGVDFVCSAGAVRSHNMDVVVTAGHCAKDGAGAWAENWTFVPGYDAGRRPYGAFTARRVLVPERWSRRGDDSHDLAMVVVNPSARGHLTEVVGGQDIGFNRPRGLRAYGFGFPADPPYDGEHLVYCAGAPHGDPHDQTSDQGMRCDLTAGSSGGPWLSAFDPATGQGVITSVSSFKYSDDPGTMYGPYFGDEARRLFETAERA